MVFEELDSIQHPVWDYGWFAVSRFRVSLLNTENKSVEHVLERFVRDPIYRRSFCESPDPWSANIERHGPFLVEAITSEWFHRKTATEIEERIDAILRDSFETPASPQQMAPIKDWLTEKERQSSSFFAINVPTGSDNLVEWSFIWPVFQEFITYNSATKELDVAVLGYD